MKFSLSAGNASGAKEGQFLLESVGKCEGAMLLMDRAYEDNKTWEFAKELSFTLVVPPKRNRKKNVGL